MSQDNLCEAGEEGALLGGRWEGVVGVEGVWCTVMRASTPPRACGGVGSGSEGWAVRRGRGRGSERECETE